LNNDILLELKGITKYFSGVEVISNINFDLEKKEVHGLVGCNGAGKTTLLNIINGIFESSKGEIYLSGEKVSIKDIRDVNKKIVGMAKQVPDLFPNFKVSENLLINHEETKKILGFQVLNNKQMVEKTKKILEFCKFNIPLNIEVANIPMNLQKQIEIAKAIATDSFIICFDEPTSAMTVKEAESLFEIIHELKEKGKSIIYVTHRLQEIFKICDRITVLRNGKKVDTVSVSDVEERDVIKMMVGKMILGHQKRTDSTDFTKKETMLEVKKISTKSRDFNETSLKNVSLKVYKGEILGIVGMVGSGKTELAKSIVGLESLRSGEIYMKGKRIDRNSFMKNLMKGIVYLPEDIIKDGIFPNMNICENITFFALADLARCFWIKRKEEKKIADNQIKEMKIKPPLLDFPAANLSGGNKKKVLISRGMVVKHSVFVLDELTMGVDIETSSELLDKLRELSKAGVSILIFSSEFERVLQILDRVLVMYEGSIIKELKDKEITQENITKYAMGVN